MRQPSFPPSHLGGYLCPCKLTWPCPSGAGRSQAVPPTALPWWAASSRLGMGGELRCTKASCDVFLASGLENRMQTIMSPQVDVLPIPLGRSRSSMDWDGCWTHSARGLQPLQQRLVPRPAAWHWPPGKGQGFGTWQWGAWAVQGLCWPAAPLPPLCLPLPCCLLMGFGRSPFSQMGGRASWVSVIPSFVILWI